MQHWNIKSNITAEIRKKFEIRNKITQWYYKITHKRNREKLQ